MQVFSSDVYFTVGTNALLASQKEYYSDLVALVDLGHSFVVIDEHQHRNLKPNTETCKHPFEQQFHQDQ